MTARRRLPAAAHAGIAATALVMVAACEQPTPIVTLQSGRTVVTSEAQAWCFGGKPGAECRDSSRSVPAVELEATPGQLVSIDVAREVAERGWYVQQSVPGNAAQSGSYPPRDDHYFTLTMPPLTVTLTVRALDGSKQPRASGGEAPDAARATGIWTFVLTPRT